MHTLLAGPRLFPLLQRCASFSVCLPLPPRHHVCLPICCKQADVATGHEVNISGGGLEDVQEPLMATLSDYP